MPTVWFRRGGARQARHHDFISRLFPVLLCLFEFWLSTGSSQTTVIGWGNDSNGQIDVPPQLTDAVAISAGRAHSLALRSDGTVLAWGANNSGQISVPVGLGNVVAISAGLNHNLALKADGSVVAWGDNTFGQTNVPTALSNVIAIAAGFISSVALRSDGTVQVWGWYCAGPNNVPGGLTNIVGIGAGYSQNLALKSDGTVRAWICHSPYSPSPVWVPSDLSNVIAVSGMWSDNLALRADGTVAAWGSDNCYGQTNVPAGLSNVVSITGGGYHSLTLGADGTVVAWGAGTNATGVDPNYGQSDVPVGLQNVIAVAAGGSHSLALLNNGSPFIVRGPAAQKVFSGAGISFKATALGAAPLYYQWQFNGASLSSATNSSLAIANVQVTDAGLYLVIVSNNFGVATSGAPLVVMEGPPVFNTQPASQPLLSHSRVVLAPSTDGSRPLTYQWRHDGVNIDGATNGALVIPNAQPSDAGTYSLALSNKFGAQTSSNALLASTHTRLFAWGDNGYYQTNVSLVLTDILSIAAGSYHSLALKSDGTVVAWGAGTTTNGGVFDYGQAIVPSGLSNVVAVSARSTRSLALRRDGTLVNWGNNAGPTNLPPNGTNLAVIIAGASHNLALTSEGTVLAWGDNSYGQTNITNIPTLTNVEAIAAGDDHNVALRSDGTVAVWGGNYYGQTNIPANLTDVVAIAAGDYNTLALKADGTVVAWGDNAFGESSVPSGLSNVMVVAGGTFFSTAIQSNGVITAWGDNYEGETNLPSGLPYAVATAGGDYHGLAIVGDGSPFLSRQPASQVVFSGSSTRFRAAALGIAPLYYQWQFNGTNLPGATGKALTLNNVQAVDSGDYTVIVTNSLGTNTSLRATLSVVNSRPVIAIQPAGSAAWLGTNVTLAVTAIGSEPLTYQWQFNGTNIVGATNSSLTLANISLNDFGRYTVVVSNDFGVATSSSATLVRMSSRVVAWGNNNSGQINVPAGLFNVSALAAGDHHNLALKDDGTLVGWGDNYYGEANIPAGLSNIVAIAAGDAFSLALKSNGTVVAWGYNVDGETNVPPGLANVVAIAAGSVHSMALKADGKVLVWGSNTDGETNVPLGLSDVVAIAAGGFHCLALRADGTIAAWGNNLNGQTNVPSGLTNVSAVAAGGYFSVALQSNGTVVAWGYNMDGETNVPPGLANVVAIAAGFYHGLALQADGKIVAWGYSGATNVPPVATNAVATGGGRYHSLALLHDPSPFFRIQPSSRQIFAGTETRFNVDVWGATPLTYQWRFQGADISGATGASLALTKVTLGAAGNYSVIASNLYGAAASRDAILTLLGPTLTGPSFGLPIAQGGFSCFVNGLSGHGPVIVYASRNLLFWSPIFTNPPVTGTMQFIDYSATNRPGRFYWAEEQ